MAAAADRNHVNTSCGDTVKCRLDAGKSPIFRSQSPCTDISVRKSQRVTIFVRIYPYKSLKGLRNYVVLKEIISLGPIINMQCIGFNTYCGTRKQIDALKKVRASRIEQG